ncbi:LPXTG cell wall anchor domain-containing protein, partial [Microbacterium sp.]|uniref:LPXTG cell wall anchor domain-containing protein n=1 Tax=Microbacterium sp. TaxID=51671 RepID=UPI002810F212
DAGGFTNTAGISHNDLTDDAVACAEPERPATPGAIALTGIDGGPIAAGAALLLLLGAALLVARRRRTRAKG